MAEVADESWWLKIGVLYDKSGFRSAALMMLDLKRAATGIYDAFKKVVSVNSDLYNTAKYLNVSTDDLQLWERAFKLIGGSAEDARGAIQSLNFVYDKLRLGMDAGAAEIGARLGLTPEDYTSFDRMLKALNRTYNEMFQGDYGGFKVLAEQLGLSKSAMLLVTQLTKDYEATLRQAGRIPFVPEHQLKSARELSKMFTELSIKWDVFKAKLLSASMPGMERLFKRLQDLMNDPKTLDNLEAFFNRMEQAFNRLATDDNLERLISLLDTLIKAGAQLAEWGVDVGSALKSGAEFTGGAVGSAVGAHESFTSQHPVLATWGKNVLNNINPASIGAKVAAAGARQLIQNIVIDGSASPKDVAEAVVDATKQEYLMTPNSLMRTVDRMSEATAV